MPCRRVRRSQKRFGSARGVAQPSTFLDARRALSLRCHRVDSHTSGSYDCLSARRRNVCRLNGRVSGAADWGARVSVVCGVWVVDLTCRGVRHVLSIGAQARYRLHRSSIRPTSYRAMGGGPRSSTLAGFRQGFGGQGFLFCNKRTTQAMMGAARLATSAATIEGRSLERAEDRGASRSEVRFAIGDSGRVWRVRCGGRAAGSTTRWSRGTGKRRGAQTGRGLRLRRSTNNRGRERGRG